MMHSNLCLSFRETVPPIVNIIHIFISMQTNYCVFTGMYIKQQQRTENPHIAAMVPDKLFHINKRIILRA
jgi:hypothetical protein